jgi:hypothetical protein
MNILMGLVVIGLAVGFAIMCLGMFREMWDGSLAMLGMAVLFVAVMVFLVGLGLVFMFGDWSGPSLREGACYRAYGSTSYVPVTSGKVTTIIPIRGVDLVEINCP